MIENTLKDIKTAVKNLKESPKSSSLTDFNAQKQKGAELLLKGSINNLLNETKGNEETYTIAKKISSAKISEIESHIEHLAGILAKNPKITSIKLPAVPSEISDEISADLKEVDLCMKSSCYRSAVILCGRIMETALHRKYFEATGNDLLEKAPGTGLGNLIAKLVEKGIEIDPGLTNQIHLINQVRIFSVHKKQKPFSPSKNQAEAIFLYTIDILEKLFSRR